MFEKQCYIDIMDMAARAYSRESIEEYYRRVRDGGLREHGFARLAANLGILIAHGRREELLSLFCDMMSLCCEQIPARCGAANDFSVKEIMLCLMEVGRAGIVPGSLLERWLDGMKNIDPLKCYDAVVIPGGKQRYNWAVFCAVSEYMRQYCGLGDTEEFVRRQLVSQRSHFDDHGMYTDPHEPILYDICTREQIALLLHLGYDGPELEFLREQLVRSADLTLKAQSVTGEIAYGGRSNQMLFNEAMQAALCEYYAAYFKALGDINAAGEFKRSAELAANALLGWLVREPRTHVKNRWPYDSRMGCEKYAYFDKYMITVASNAYMAYIMADDGITPLSCPADKGGYICRTGEMFHKTFCNAGGYFIEIDTRPDPAYDAAGVGRVHRAGAPSALCLSVPFAAHPGYYIGKDNPGYLSLCPARLENGEWRLGADPETEYVPLKDFADRLSAGVEFRCNIAGGIVDFRCSAAEDGVRLSVSGSGKVGIFVPLFESDGAESTEIFMSDRTARVTYGRWYCDYTTNGIFTDTAEVYTNRNGVYRAAVASADGSVTVHIRMDSHPVVL